MMKHLELINKKSCLNRAADDEPVFVLRGKDIAAPATIRNWAEMRILAKKNKPTDRQILEAFDLALEMEIYQCREKARRSKGKSARLSHSGGPTKKKTSSSGVRASREDGRRSATASAKEQKGIAEMCVRPILRGRRSLTSARLS